MIVNGLIIIAIGVTGRWLTVVAVTFESKYVLKERVFMAFAWIPKATVQAAISGIILSEAVKKGYTQEAAALDESIPDYQTPGQAIVTAAVSRS